MFCKVFADNLNLEILSEFSFSYRRLKTQKHSVSIVSIF